MRSKLREEEKELQTQKSTFENPASGMIANSKQDTSGELQYEPIQTQTGAAKMFGDLTKRLEKGREVLLIPPKKISNKNQNKGKKKDV